MHNAAWTDNRASNTGTFACHTFPRDTKASKRANFHHAQYWTKGGFEIGSTFGLQKNNRGLSNLKV
jgi:hypothetical protein